MRAVVPQQCLPALAGAIALYGVATCVRGERWQALLRHNGAHPKRADSYALTAVGYMGNNVLPARAGDAFRVVFMAPRAGIGTLVAERLLDIAVLGTAFLVLTFGVVDHAGLPSGSRLRFVAGAVIVAGIVAAAAIVVAHRAGVSGSVGGSCPSAHHTTPASDRTDTTAPRIGIHGGLRSERPSDAAG